MRNVDRRSAVAKLRVACGTAIAVAVASLMFQTASIAQPSTDQSSRARSWPQRSVRFIVSQGPGSAQDIGARMFADRLSKRWGQSVVVENRPGADGINAITTFVGARDNHTLLFTASGTFTAHPVLHASLPYDPGDLVPIAKVSTTIIAVAVPTALKVNTLDELVTLARREPGRINLAPTPGTTEITFDSFLKAANITMTKIPYGDITKALTDLSENRIQVIVSGIAVVKSQVDAGKVKLLAITNLKRSPLAADLPTATEAGYPALALDGLVGLFGPRGLPANAVEQIAADVIAVSADPQIATRLAATGQQLDPAGPAAFAAAVDAQRQSIAATAKALHIQPVR
jgi:tripartite-type tricarboxylate transporter receptor subunit TctC